MPSSFTLLAILVTAAILLMATLYHFKSNWRKTVVFIGSSLGVAAAAAGAILTGLELRESTDQYRQSVRLKRQEVSFLYMEKFQGIPDKALLRNAIDGLAGKSPEEIQEFFLNQPADGTRISDMLSFFEDTAVAVRVDYADEPTLCAFLEEPAVRYYRTLEKWIDYFRKAGGAPSYLEHYQWLYDRWKQGCSLGPSVER